MNILKDIAGFIAGSIMVILIIAFNILLAAAFICFMIWIFTGELPFGWLS